MDGKKVAIIAAIIIVVVGAIIFAITNSFSNRNRGVREEPLSVTDVFAARSVRMTVMGPVEANETHESYRIEVGVDFRTIEAISGYNMEIVANDRLTNNRPAYTDFVHALSRAGFDNERRKVSETAADLRGACATGKRYVFELLDDGRTIRTLWTSSCSKTKGTLDARYTALKNLFDEQIPERRETLEPIDLR